MSSTSHSESPRAQSEQSITRREAIGLTVAGALAVSGQAHAVEATPRVAGPPREQDLSDAEWLATWCGPVRDELQDTTTFDRAALQFRKLRVHMRGLGHVAAGAVPDISEPGSGPVADLIVQLTTLDHPSGWYVCGKCKGRNQDHPDCDDCGGAGFRLSVRKMPAAG
jgi:hypothetical protein